MAAQSPPISDMYFTVSNTAAASEQALAAQILECDTEGRRHEHNSKNSGDNGNAQNADISRHDNMFGNDETKGYQSSRPCLVSTHGDLPRWHPDQAAGAA